MINVNDILTRIQRGESPEAIANECAKAINDAIELDKKAKEAAKQKEEKAKVDARLNELAQTMVDSILEYVKLAAPEVASKLGDDIIDVSEVRSTLDGIIPMVAAAAKLCDSSVKTVGKISAQSPDAAISAFLKSFVD